MSWGFVGGGVPVRRVAAREAAGRKCPFERRVGRGVPGVGAEGEVRKGGGTFCGECKWNNERWWGGGGTYDLSQGVVYLGAEEVAEVLCGFIVEGIVGG
jgi:hypothetical protein